MAAPKQTLYDILGVSRDALPMDVSLAYEKRQAELQAAGTRDPGARALLRQAHEVLSDPKRRAAYDASLVTAAERDAAMEQAAPDLELEPEGSAKPRPKIPAWAIAAAVVLAVIAIFFALRTGHEPMPKKVDIAEAPPPPPPPPPPPQPKSPKEILAQSLRSVGRLQGVEMSGRAVPVGLALAVEPGAMVTTCHGIPAGSQLVVTIGAESHSATLAVTDEVLDLCRLSVEGLRAPALTVAPGEPKEGLAIHALGANAAGELALTDGTVKRIVPDTRGKVLEVSMPVAPNGSGGAIFDDYGHLVAIATTTQGHGVSGAYPASWIAQMRSRTK